MQPAFDSLDQRLNETGQQNQQADRHEHQPGAIPPPGAAGQRGRGDAGRQDAEQSDEPGTAVDVPLRALAAPGRFQEPGVRQHGGQEQQDRDRQLQRRQPADDGARPLRDGPEAVPYLGIRCHAELRHPTAVED